MRWSRLNLRWVRLKECKGEIPPSLGDIPELHFTSILKAWHRNEERFLNRDVDQQFLTKQLKRSRKISIKMDQPVKCVVVIGYARTC